VERDGHVVARLPYAVRGARRMRVLTQPPLTQTLGPWVERPDAKPATALAREMELLTALEAALPPAGGFVQQFSPTMMNGLPFFWAGYGLGVQYTYRLEGLQSEDVLWDGLRSNIRREIRKARRTVEVRDDLALDRFHDIYTRTFARQEMRAPYSLEQLERLDAACAPRSARTVLSAHDEAGRIHAVAYIVWDRHAAYYLLGGGDPALRVSGASSLLMWEAIVRARDVTDVFDFEGSMIQPVERFFRSFGARQVPYLRVTRLNAAARAALALRSRWVAGPRSIRRSGG
jgi:hypothetical protein